MPTVKITAEVLDLKLPDGRVVIVTAEGVISVRHPQQEGFYRLALPSMTDAAERCWQNHQRDEDDTQGSFLIRAEHIHG